MKGRIEFLNLDGADMEVYRDLIQLSAPVISAIALYFFQKMSESVSELNKNVAVVIARMEQHSEYINEGKISALRNANDISELKIKMAATRCLNSGEVCKF
jgi:uncharacterized protein YoxC